MAKEKHTATSYLKEAERGMKMNRILKKFGIKGGWTWDCLLQLLCLKPNYYIVVGNDDDVLEDLADYCMVEKGFIIEFMNYITSKYPEHFNSVLWNEYRVIRNDKQVADFIERLYTGSKARTGKVMTTEEILTKEKLTKINRTESNLTQPKEIEPNLIQPNLREITERKGTLPKEMILPVMVGESRGIIENDIKDNNPMDGYYNLNKFFNSFKRNVIYQSLEDQDDFNQITSNFFKENIELQKKVYIHLKSKLTKTNNLDTEILYLQLDTIFQPN